MMTNGIRIGWGRVAVLALGAVFASGCATQGFVQTEVAKARGYTDEQVGAVRGDVERVRGDVGQVSMRTDQAMQKATLAERLASGEVEYTEISTHRVQFAFDDYQLNDEAKTVLDDLASKLSSHSGYVLEVRGYADATGSARYNYRLGRERCDSVVRYLISAHEVPASRLVTVSFGEDDPMADNQSSNGRAQNRRVQVRLLSLETGGEPLATAP